MNHLLAMKINTAISIKKGQQFMEEKGEEKAVEILKEIAQEVDDLHRKQWLVPAIESHIRLLTNLPEPIVFNIIQEYWKTL